MQRDVKMMPNQIVNKDGKPYVQMKLNGKTNVFSPQEITAMTLKKMKEAAEGFLGEKIKDAVITVPGTSSFQSIKIIKIFSEMYLEKQKQSLHA